MFPIGRVKLTPTPYRVHWRARYCRFLKDGYLPSSSFPRRNAAGRILLLLVPVLYVNQEMVLRLGTVTGAGHARLNPERFGRFWGAFSVIDLFLLQSP